ncbi:MAG: endonuclease/exonuclease/phosphatase family protein [Enterobacteriaceae bacterium]
MRYVAGQPARRVFPHPHDQNSYRHDIQENTLVNTSNLLKIMVWNIYKQQRANWLSILKRYGSDLQLLLLQEAQSTPELINFATANYLSADQVPAVVFPQHPSGVMTLASAHPLYCCPLREREPLLRLAKSALVTVYPLQEAISLMVVNIHAVNFSLGTNVYSKQLDPIGSLIESHQGPVILAGDFNAWSKHRILALYGFAHSVGLHEVEFSHDRRKRAFGRPLDFIFYRNLQPASSTVLVTNASDHNPLLAEFLLESQSHRTTEKGRI